MPTTPTEETTKKAPAKRAPRKKVEKVADEALEVLEKTQAEDETTGAAAKDGSYIATVGRRKTSVARVRLIKNGKGVVTINSRPMLEYFTTYELRDQVLSPLKLTGQETACDVSVKVEGGGIRGQAEAIRHGVSRALIVLNPTYRKSLKKLGYLTRDSRKRERKKFGLKSARRAPQWSKR